MSSTGKVYIYTLSDPRDQSIHYVGMSKNPRQRWYQHNQGIDGSESKIAWIQELRNLRLKSVLTIIETVEANSLSDAWHREKHWIEFYAQQGAPLTNLPNTMEEFFKSDTWLRRHEEGHQW